MGRNLPSRAIPTIKYSNLPIDFMMTIREEMKAAGEDPSRLVTLVLAEANDTSPEVNKTIKREYIEIIEMPNGYSLVQENRDRYVVRKD